MPTRRSTIRELEVVRLDPPELVLDLRVSSGTYIRAIADRLGGHCTGLRRTEVGRFTLADADQERLLAPAEALAHLPAHALTDEELGLVTSGRAITGPVEGPTPLLHADRLVAVGVGDGERIRPETVLA
jgi:tRNA U55 pseudouridine synthase TruB